MTPAITIAPNAIFQPVSPPPKSVTAPATMTIKPAAGPLMVSRDPAKKLTTKPPMMAVRSPVIGGKSEALAMPKLRGSANKKTMNPEMASVAPCALRPARPSAGRVFFSVFCCMVESVFPAIQRKRVAVFTQLHGSRDERTSVPPADGSREKPSPSRRHLPGLSDYGRNALNAWNRM